jgi:hypothetical protein
MMPVQPVSAIRGGEGDVVVDKFGRLRQRGLMRRGDLANQSCLGVFCSLPWSLFLPAFESFLACL